jgi:hypothetical protein
LIEKWQTNDTSMIIGNYENTYSTKKPKPESIFAPPPTDFNIISNTDKP